MCAHERPDKFGTRRWRMVYGDCTFRIWIKHCRNWICDNLRYNIYPERQKKEEKRAKESGKGRGMKKAAKTFTSIDTIVVFPHQKLVLLKRTLRMHRNATYTTPYHVVRIRPAKQFWNNFQFFGRLFSFCSAEKKRILNLDFKWMNPNTDWY